MNIKKIIIRGTIFLLLGLMAGCSGLTVLNDQGEDITVASPLYTLANLHPDEARKKLYAVNYQQPGLIPLCTEVDVLVVNKKVMKFQVKETGVTYNYYYHRAAAEPFDQHIFRFFGATCNRDKVKTLSEIDQKGIKLGKALQGMSKEGVVFAMGLPPMHRTPSTELNTWLYWKNRWGTMSVSFDENGKVNTITGG